MNTKTRIKELIDNSSNIGSVAELERKLNIANGTINKWDKARPSVDVLSKVADYFKVSVDYLLCRTDEPSAKLESESEFGDLIGMLRQSENTVPDEKKKEFHAQLETYIKFVRQQFEDED